MQTACWNAPFDSGWGFVNANNLWEFEKHSCGKERTDFFQGTSILADEKTAEFNDLKSSVTG